MYHPLLQTTQKLQIHTSFVTTMLLIRKEGQLLVGLFEVHEGRQVPAAQPKLFPYLLSEDMYGINN